ncbi:Shwachman-Bodian-diamond syndrome protein [Lentithecium fluviatile CBS 122367]|uniref:Shwachman-Bodian-diamond syndrome protein n=1 Tax=Lentithecium fluviatile CBS 122367 TaxID=1168545 RepID=A0A6G1J0V3_9PLEO|nr:Shwachman-Bodian-diamond syndrome protein [Lentithecium fluviatile CBS 122367]
MPAGIKQPGGSVKFTNLAVVRMRKGKQKFELACYKNKVMDFRNDIEDKLDEVLQVDTIWEKVGNKVHNDADIKKAWPGIDMNEVILDILKHGEVQIGQKERNAETERIKHEVLDIVASQLINPTTKALYPTTMIEKALDTLSSQSTNRTAEKQPETAPETAGGDVDVKKPQYKWRGVIPGKDAKPQAIFAMRCLVEHQPIAVARVQMKIRVTCPTSVLKQGVKSVPKAQHEKETGNGEEKAHGSVKDVLLGYFAEVPSQETIGAEWEAVGLIEPGTFKTMSEFINGHTKGRGNIEVLDTAVGKEV